MFQVGDLVRIKSKILNGMKYTWENTPQWTTFTSILKVKSFYASSYCQFDYPPSIGDHFNVLQEDLELATTNIKNVDADCSCSTRDLLNFGHKCGKKAPIDRLWIFKSVGSKQ